MITFDVIVWLHDNILDGNIDVIMRLDNNVMLMINTIGWTVLLPVFCNGQIFMLYCFIKSELHFLDD
jgi:hypothetical protein